MVDKLTAVQATERIAELEAALRKCVAHAEGIEAALQSRDVIGQAKGILMERGHVDAQTAFSELVLMSQTLNQKLRDVAQRIATE
jgi:AmiR/NasT family two-component response regulator